MAYTTGNHEPSSRETEYRAVDVHGYGTLNLERSRHPIGVTWRSWETVGAGIPADIAKIRCDCGNGLISDEERKRREMAWGLALKKARKAARTTKAEGRS